MSTSKWTYETLRTTLAELAAPVGEDRRTIWVLNGSLGLAKTSQGGFEVFLVGSRLVPTSAVVRRHLEHGLWRGSLQEQEFFANRVVLPNATHFASIAALIAIELVQAGMGSSCSLEAAFTEVEPIIELALRRGALAEDSIVGLIGELLTLEQMLLTVLGQPELRNSVLDMWRGHQQGARDFVIGSRGVEVKTTTHETSSHHISSLFQIEPTPREELPEAKVYLLSIGISAAEESGFSLPDIVDRLLLLLRGPETLEAILSPLQQRLVRDIASYAGTGEGGGYNHSEMRLWAPYQHRFRLTFTPRLYDMTDAAIKVIRRADVLQTHVSPGEISYRVDLPNTVRTGNPAPDWRRSLRSLVIAALEA